jgi:hypothetical protein
MLNGVDGESAKGLDFNCSMLKSAIWYSGYLVWKGATVPTERPNSYDLSLLLAQCQL